MPKAVRLRTEAEVEATLARQWYETISDEVAAGFVSDLKHTINAISEHPQSSQLLESLGSIRMRIFRKYPYVAFFRELEEEVEILAISHTSREPGYWKNRLD